MQDFVCADLSSGNTTTLIDKRDGNTYGVYRIPADAIAENVAGKCIMTENLKLGRDPTTGEISDITVNSATSNYDSNASSSEFESFALSGNYTITYTTTASDYSDNTYSSRLFTYDTSNKRYGYYTWGAALVACPKGWRLPMREEYGTTSSMSGVAHTAGIGMIVGNSATGGKAITSSPWSFVVGGRILSDGWHYKGTIGYYYTSTQASQEETYVFAFWPSSYVRVVNTTKQQGASVRCISITETESSGTMQEFQDSDLSNEIGSTAYLTDIRDGRVYRVRRLADGKVWMTQNLALGSGSAVTLTPKYSDVSSDISLLASDSSNFSSSSSSKFATYYATKGTVNTDGITLPEDTTFYNSAAALGSTSSTTAQSVCPKGWHLPNGGSDTATNEAYSLVRAYGGSTSFEQTNTEVAARLVASDGPAFTTSGGIEGGSLYGTAAGYRTTQISYYFLINPGTGLISSHRLTSSHQGRAVRCIAD